eukprot:6083269-Pyramimonas_sp.AAC.1
MPSGDREPFGLSYTLRTPWSNPTWADLCGAFFLRSLIDAISNATQAGSLKEGCWNVRYLKSTTAHNNMIKHAFLTQMTTN